MLLHILLRFKCYLLHVVPVMESTQFVDLKMKRSTGHSFQRTLRAMTVACWMLVVFGPSKAVSQEARPILLSFGKTTVALDYELLQSIEGRGRSESRSLRTFDVKDNNSVIVLLPSEVLTGYSPPCDPIANVFLISGSLPPRSQHFLFKSGLQREITEFGGISKLVPASGRPILDLYQFDSPMMKDFWGDQISFYQTGTLARMKLQITRDLRIEIQTWANRCFFERAELLTANLQKFVMSKIKSKDE